MRYVAPRPSDPRVALIVDACESLLPLWKASRELLKRKRVSAAELAAAVPGLAAWPARHRLDYAGIDVAILIATGSDPYTIVAKLTGTRRTGEQVKKLYRKWLGKRPRAKAA